MILLLPYYNIVFMQLVWYSVVGHSRNFSRECPTTEYPGVGYSRRRVFGTGILGEGGVTKTGGYSIIVMDERKLLQTSLSVLLK